MSDYAISDELAQAVVDYLVTRPWGEVNHLIRGLSTLEEVNPCHETAKEPPPAAP